MVIFITKRDVVISFIVSLVFSLILGNSLPGMFQNFASSLMSLWAFNMFIAYRTLKVKLQ